MRSTRRQFVLSSLPAAAATAANKLPADGPRLLIAGLTMLDGRAQFDDTMNRDYLAHLQQGGADGVLVLGTTGEFSSFSVRERKQILESAIRHKGKLSIMAQVATPNLPETLELLDHAARAGAGSALVLPPFYFKNPSLDGLTAFYEPVLRAARVPVYLYNIPQLSGAPISAELLARLSSHEHLVGVKDSFSKTDAMLALMGQFPKLHYYTGVTANIAANLAAGGAGTITGSGSYFLSETLAIFEAHRKGGDRQAAQTSYDAAARAMAGYANIPASKFAMTLRGLKESACRPPFTTLTAIEKQALKAKLT
ncbi:MAG: dihydrodipicolinate synthase family protein [Acidobacteriia bacterium]|nr:dihydrodipicolinate synthase family protein [Terriglobia bacterium]